MALLLVTLRRSDVFNALNVQLISEMVILIGLRIRWSYSIPACDSDGAEYLRVIVLRGDGKHLPVRTSI